jgi:hypothetical protein
VIPWYAWLFPLADANGSFELTNLRVLWCKVGANLPNFTLETLSDLIRIFHERGLLFIWEENGKRYGHWVGSEKPGRLPQPTRRTARYGPLLAPPVPAAQLQSFQLRQQKCRIATAEASPVLVLDWYRSGIGGEKEGAPEDGAPLARAKPQPSPSAFPGTHLKVSERQDRMLAEAFPWVDRQAEYRKADSWLEANPDRRPKHTARFLHNWFSKIPSPSDGKGGTNHDEQRREITRKALNRVLPDSQKVASRVH